MYFKLGKIYLVVLCSKPILFIASIIVKSSLSKIILLYLPISSTIKKYFILSCNSFFADIVNLRILSEFSSFISSTVPPTRYFLKTIQKFAAINGFSFFCFVIWALGLIGFALSTRFFVSLKLFIDKVISSISG